MDIVEAQKKTSKKTNRSFWIHPTNNTPIDGIACFNKEEVETLKEMDPGERELNYLLDRRGNESTSIDILLSDYFLEKDTPIHKPTILPQSIPKKSQADIQRETLAKEWAGKIKETIANTQVRTAMSDAIVLSSKDILMEIPIELSKD